MLNILLQKRYAKLTTVLVSKYQMTKNDKR